MENCLKFINIENDDLGIESEEEKNLEDKIYVNIDNESIVYDSENDYIKAIGGGGSSVSAGDLLVLNKFVL